MKPEYQVLFASVRQDFQADHLQAVRQLAQQQVLDWGLIFAIAEGHGVGPLVYHNLDHRSGPELGIPSPDLKKFQLSALRNTILKERRAQELERALAFFHERGTDVMLVKGAALDVLVYEQPWYTVTDDTDIILRCKPEEVSEAERHEIGKYLYRRGIEYDFYAHHDLNINGALPVDFDRVWADARRETYRGHPAFFMAPEDLLISICINSCRKRFLRLKSLCDLAETVAKFPAISWERVVEKAHQYDCCGIVYTAGLVTARTLGGSIPNEVLADLKVNPLRVRLIRTLAEHLIKNASLSSYPFAGKKILGTEVNAALVLPYASYRSYQVRRRMREVLRARREGH